MEPEEKLAVRWIVGYCMTLFVGEPSRAESARGYLEVTL